MPAGNVGLANRAKNGGHGFVQQIVVPAVRNRPIEQHQHKEFARPFGSFALQAEARRNIGSGRSPCVSFEDPFLDGLETRTSPRNLEKAHNLSVALRKTNARSWNYPELLEYALASGDWKRSGRRLLTRLGLSDDLSVKAPA